MGTDGVSLQIEQMRSMLEGKFGNTVDADGKLSREQVHVRANHAKSWFIGLAKVIPGVNERLSDLRAAGLENERFWARVAQRVRERHAELKLLLPTEKVQDKTIDPDSEEGKKLDQTIKNVLENIIVDAARSHILEHSVELNALDDLTGLPRRAWMILKTREMVDHSKHTVIHLFIDMNDLKKLNDTYGHSAGDDMLAEIGSRIRTYCREYTRQSRPTQKAAETIPELRCEAARWGGDEFLMSIEFMAQDGAPTRQELMRLVKDFYNQIFNEPIAVRVSKESPGLSENGRVQVQQTGSIGATVGHKGENLEDLDVRMDRALYKAKSLKSDPDPEAHIAFV